MMFGAAWAILLGLAVFTRPKAVWLYPALGLVLLIVFRDERPVLRLAASSLLFLYLMKAAALARLPDLRLRPLDRALYFSVWPGMDPERLAMRSAPAPGTGTLFGRGLTVGLVGLGGVAGLAIFRPLLSNALVGWLGIAALLLTIHFGFSGCLTAAVRLIGRPVGSLFENPFASATLSDFWTRRWNLAYVEMNRRLFVPLFRRRLGLRASVFTTFLVSGLLHEMAISYPAGGGWGGPLLYFAIQGVAVLAERRWRLRSRLLTWLVLLAPLPLLFHAPFRAALIVPLYDALHGVWAARPLAWYVGALLWALGIFQLLVLGASFQVPSRLNWREELPRLSPFNRKLLWTYGAFIVATIVAFGILTLALHGSFLRGEPAAIGLAIFICLFWTLRLLTDTFYFRSDEWPAGEDLQAGHALLNALFVFLTLGYGTVAVWGLVVGRA